MPPSPLARLTRIAGALPDVLTAIACVVVWMSPFAFGRDAVKTVVLMMLMEFLLVHGTAFFTAIAFSDRVRKYKRVLAMLGMQCFYALFLAAFAISFGAWWPVWVFLWLVVSKAAWIFLDPRDRALEQERQMKAWTFSVAAYLGAVFAALVLPLPRLGLGEDVVPQLGLPGSGEWIERPHTAVAAMAIYYVAMATFKWCMDRPRATPPT
ncbi:MAG: hypothetical protein EOP93_17280 [Lysobacteraceae bacterium]|nr:MAG: hypothetical protein EOP93_17280 [Xanthomonadaceae bacterium]